MANMKYGLFILKKEKENLENKIEELLDDCHPYIKDEQMKANSLRRFNDELDSINLTIESIHKIQKMQGK